MLKSAAGGADPEGGAPVGSVGADDVEEEPVLDAEEPTEPPVDDDIPRSLMAELRELGLVGQMWTITVVVFCALRAVVVWPVLVEHDVNPWWFLALDVGTSPTYGLGQAMGVKLLRDDRRPMRDALPWIAMLFVSFVAPYAYLLASAGKLPGYVIAGVILWMLVFGVLAAFRVRKEVRLGAALG